LPSVIDKVEEDGKIYFQTKGDANEDPDPNRFSIEAEIIDKVVYHLPYIGFYASFMRNKVAFLAFICVPALVLLALLGRDMWVAINETKGRKRNKATSSVKHIASGKDGA
jgi:signal peptidase